VREREGEIKRARFRETKKERVCVGRERERESVCVCVCDREREREIAKICFYKIMIISCKIWCIKYKKPKILQKKTKRFNYNALTALIANAIVFTQIENVLKIRIELYSNT